HDQPHRGCPLRRPRSTHSVLDVISAPRGVAWRRLLRRQPTFVIGLAVLVVILASGVLAPAWWTGDPQQMRPAQRLQPPSAVRWFGSDHFGRDVYTRTLYGARVSLVVGASVALL